MGTIGNDRNLPFLPLLLAQGSRFRSWRTGQASCFRVVSASTGQTKLEKLTTKQRGDAAEHYVISMLGFNNIPASKMPDNWPGYDLVARLPGDFKPFRVSVKFRTYSDAPGAYIGYEPEEMFDFIALVIKYPTGLRTWILPRDVANKTALNPKGSKSGKFTKREWQIKSIEKRFSDYENNFGLAAHL